MGGGVAEVGYTVSEMNDGTDKKNYSYPKNKM